MARDPAIIPATGTPEPGGGAWWPTLRFLDKLIKRANVVACDVVELAPSPGLHHADFTAARLIYKLVGMRFHPLGGAEKPLLLAVPYAVDDGAPGFPSLLEKRAKAARLFEQGSGARDRILGAVDGHNHLELVMPLSDELFCRLDELLTTILQ